VICNEVTCNNVIPGRTEGAGPESIATAVSGIWIPGSLAALAPRNDRKDYRGASDTALMPAYGTSTHWPSRSVPST